MNDTSGQKKEKQPPVELVSWQSKWLDGDSVNVRNVAIMADSLPVDRLKSFVITGKLACIGVDFLTYFLAFSIALAGRDVLYYFFPW